MSIVTPFWFYALLAVATSPENGTTGASSIARARALFEQGEYEQTVRLLQDPLPALSLDQLARKDELLGTALAYTGQTEASLRVFTHLLIIAPGYDLPYTTSPKATFVFEKARTQASRRTASRVDLQLPPSTPFGEPLEIRVTVRGPALTLIQKWRFCYRLNVQGQRYQCLQQSRTRGELRSRFVLPPFASPPRGPQGELIRVYVQLALSGFDVQGNEVYRNPSQSQPREQEIGVVAAGPWYTNAWVWGTVAGVTLAGTVATVALLLALQPTTMQVEGRVLP